MEEWRYSSTHSYWVGHRVGLDVEVKRKIPFPPLQGIEPLWSLYHKQHAMHINRECEYKASSRWGWRSVRIIPRKRASTPTRVGVKLNEKINDQRPDCWVGSRSGGKYEALRSDRFTPGKEPLITSGIRMDKELYAPAALFPWERASDNHWISVSEQVLRCGEGEVIPVLN